MLYMQKYKMQDIAKRFETTSKNALNSSLSISCLNILFFVTGNLFPIFLLTTWSIITPYITAKYFLENNALLTTRFRLKDVYVFLTSAHHHPMPHPHGTTDCTSCTDQRSPLMDQMHQRRSYQLWQWPRMVSRHFLSPLWPLIPSPQCPFFLDHRISPLCNCRCQYP